MLSEGGKKGNTSKFCLVNFLETHVKSWNGTKKKVGGTRFKEKATLMKNSIENCPLIFKMVAKF